MIEGGGLGVFAPEEIGPIDVQVANGVVDVAVADEAEAVARRQAVPRRTSRARSTEWDVRRPAPAAARSIPENRLRGLRRARRDRRRWPTPARCSSCAAASAPGWSPRWSGSRAGRSASSPTTRRTSAARSTPTAPTRPPASCSCATRSTCRSCSSATRPGSWSGPRPRRPRSVRHVQPAVRHRRQPHRAVRHDRAAQGLRPRRAGDGRRQLQGAALHAWPGRPASSAAWASRARCGSASATSSRPIDDPDERERAVRARWSTACTSTGKARQRRHATSRSTTSSTPPTPAAGSPPRSRRRPPPRPRDGQEAPEHRHLVNRARMHPPEPEAAGAADAGAGRADAAAVRGGPSISRLVTCPPPLEIVEHEGLYVLIDDGPARGRGPTRSSRRSPRRVQAGSDRFRPVQAGAAPLNVAPTWSARAIATTSRSGRSRRPGSGRA